MVLSGSTDAPLPASTLAPRTGQEGNGKKKILVFCDGTGNDMFNGGCPTNIQIMSELAKADSPDSRQVVLYFKGVGVQEFQSSVITGKVVDGISAKSMPYKIKSIYAQLCLVYTPGDDIYLFGFSRGALMMRLLSCFIFYYGIIKKEEYNATKLVDFWNAYILQRAYPEVLSLDSHRATITFMGLFDTVPGLSGDDFDLYDLFYYSEMIKDKNMDTMMDANNQPLMFIQKYAHFMATDITSDYCNYSFYVDWDTWVPNSANNTASKDVMRKEWMKFISTAKTHCRWVDNDKECEIRYPGDHCCIGGGWIKDPKNTKCLANRTLRDMMSRAGSHLFYPFKDDEYPVGTEVKGVLNYKDMGGGAWFPYFEYLTYNTRQYISGPPVNHDSVIPSEALSANTEYVSYCAIKATFTPPIQYTPPMQYTPPAHEDQRHIV
jgi:hypothetical protein